MSDLKDVSPINLLTGMSAVSLASGNKLGEIIEPFIDPINGVLLGMTLLLSDGTRAGLLHDEIYSFGRDAVMVRDDSSIIPLDEEGGLPDGRPMSRLIGTKIITEGGDVLGQITNVFVTLQPPPRILYEARQSLMDKLLGRSFFVPASLGHAISDDGSRLIVPEITSDIASPDLAELVGQNIEIRSYEPGETGRDRNREDDTVVVADEDETVVRFMDDEDTVLRHPRQSES